ncbi:MAG: methyltransferase domain-containing protein [Candidatus Nealsonbacteria bacterium]
MKKFQQSREVINYAKKYISGSTLDLGAGFGKYRSIIEPNTSSYTTFDMAPGKNIDVVGDALNLPFPEESFETVVSTQVLEHVEKPWVMVKEIYRVLKPGGRCILTAPFMGPYHPDPGDYFRYTVDGIRSLFKNEGFQIIECDYNGQVFSVLSEFVRFSCFNPFKKRKRGSFKITHLMARIARFLDRFTKNKIIYSNVYIIAQK